VSGTSARRFDDTVEGVDVGDDGMVRLDPAAQSRAVLTNVERILTDHGLDRGDLVDATAFLVDMGHFDAWNEAWAEFFTGREAPADHSRRAGPSPSPPAD